MCRIWGVMRSGVKWNSDGNSSRNCLIRMSKLGTSLVCFRNTEGTDFTVYFFIFQFKKFDWNFLLKCEVEFI